MPGLAFATESLTPTYLESGDNDLIRFRKGGVPSEEDARQPLLESHAQPASRSKSMAKPVPVERKQRAFQSLVSPQGLTAGIPPRMEDAAEPAQVESEALAQPLPAVSDSPAAPAPSPAKIDDAIDARLVTVCLNNPSDANGAKAFDIRRDAPPRYIAEEGATSCARFEPTRHTLFLWKTNELGALSLILSSRLDLNDADGTQVSLDWVRDR